MDRSRERAWRRRPDRPGRRGGPGRPPRDGRALPALVVVALALGVACAGETGPPAPREIVFGVDVCEYCHMSVDDLELAAQWVEPGGRARPFDEPGCLVAWLQAEPSRPGAGFVADADGTGWVPVEEASFVRGGPATSMGFDIRAYRSREAAERAAAETGGTVMDWETLRREGVRDAHTH